MVENHSSALVKACVSFKNESRRKFFTLNIRVSFLNLENFLLTTFALHAGIIADIVWYFLEFSNFKWYKATGHGYDCMFLIGFNYLACSWHGVHCCAMRVREFQDQMPQTTMRLPEVLPQL